MSPRSLLILAASLSLAWVAAPQTAPQTAPPPAPATAVAPAAVPPAPSFLQPSPEVVDFGDVFVGEPARGSVTLTNTSDGDRAVAQVHTSCGCTVATVHGPDGAEIPSKPTNPELPIVTLHPGQSIKVDVEMMTANARGAVEKQLQIEPMDASLPKLQVPVRARVSQAFSVSPEQVNLEKISKSGPVEKLITIQSQVPGPWTIDGFSSGIDGHPLPADMQFNVLDKEGDTRRIQILSPGPRAVGPITLKVHVAIGHERVKGADFYVYGMVQPDVSFDTGNPNFPDSISFDQMEAGTKVTRTLKITNADRATPYVLESVEVQAPKPEFFTTAIRTIEPGISYEVDITADAAVNEAFFRGMLVLHAQHPDLKDRSIMFHGWVRKG